MHDLLLDLRHGVRMLAKRPAFTAAAALSLALGIGANTTIFSVVNALLFRTLPVHEPARLVSIYTTDAKNPGVAALSHLNWKDYRAQNDTFESMLGYDWVPMSVAAGGEAGLVFGQLVSGNYFDVLGVEPALGRTFTAEEDGAPGAHPVAVLSHDLWTERLSADASAVGRTITVNGHPFTVIGVAPARFTGTDTGIQPALWLPMAMQRQIRINLAVNWYEERRGLFVNTIGRLKPGVDLAAARADLETIAARLEQEYPDDNKGRGVQLVPLQQAAIGPNFRENVVAASTLLMTVVGVVLLIACANVANLLLARATSRRKEIAIRLSIGARRSRLVRQLLTESVLLSLLGAGLGLLLTLWAQSVLLTALPALPFPVANALELPIDGRVLAFTLAVALATGLLFGIVPARQATRPELVGMIKDQGDAALDRRRRFGVRDLLVVVQVALSLVGLVGAALFLRGLAAAQETDPGFETQRLLVTSFDIGMQGIEQARGEQLYERMIERVGSLPGVAAAAVATGGPLQGTMVRSVFMEGAEGPEDRRFIQVNTVGPGYFESVGVPIERGRGIQASDRPGAPRAVVVNRTMAELLWPQQDALGKRFRFFGDPDPAEVVGVARDATYNVLGEDPQPYVYESIGQRYYSGVTLIVRTKEDPAPALSMVERELKALVPGMPLVGSATVAELLGDSLWAPRMGASLLGVFGLLGLVLASVGIYGVMSYTVGQRAREIGIRMALGARHRDVLRLVVMRGMLLVAAGLAAGVALSLVATRLVAGMLFGVSPMDPVAFGVTLGTLALVGFLANAMPARRATAVDPVTVLKND